MSHWTRAERPLARGPWSGSSSWAGGHWEDHAGRGDGHQLQASPPKHLQEIPTASAEQRSGPHETARQVTSNSVTKRTFSVAENPLVCTVELAM